MARRYEWGTRASRRGVLGGVVAAVAGTAGCRLFVRADQESPGPDPDVVVTMRALAAEQALIDAYAHVAKRHGSLAKRLAAFRRRHVAHREALHARLPVDPSGRVVTPTPTAVASGTSTSSASAAGASASASATASASASASATVADSLGALVAAERAAAAARVTDALDAGPTLAEVLASIGACEAAHADLLTELNA